MEAELTKIKRELEPQTPVEREERLRAEVVEDLSHRPSQRMDAGSSRSMGFSSEVEARERVEQRVLNRLARIAPPLFEIQDHVKAPGSNLYLDALLIAQVDQIPDLVVEIKSAGRHAARNARNRIAEAESQLLRYMARFRRSSLGWLILVLTEDIDAEERHRIEAAGADVSDVFEVSVVTPSEIDELVLPISKPGATVIDA